MGFTTEILPSLNLLAVLLLIKVFPRFFNQFSVITIKSFVTFLSVSDQEMTAGEKIDRLLMARVSKQRVTSQSLRDPCPKVATVPRAILFLDLSRSF